MKIGNRIKDIFSPDAFCIEKLVSDHNCSRRDFLVRVNNYEYLMTRSEMDRLCHTYRVNINEELTDPHYPRVISDNRPLWKKDMDMRMGKFVNFEHKPLNYPSISADRVVALVGNRAAVFVEEDGLDLE